MRSSSAIAFISITQFLFNYTSVAQTVYTHNAPGMNCYCQMIFSDTVQHPHAVIVLDAKGADLRTFATSNIFSTSPSIAGKNLVYLNIVNQGSSSELECYEVAIRSISSSRKINPSLFYLLLNQSKSQVFIQKASQQKINFNIAYYNKDNVQDVLASIDTTTWNVKYSKPDEGIGNEARIEKRMKNYAKNFDLGVNLSLLGLTGNKLNLSKGLIGVWSLSLAKNVTDRSGVKFSFGASFKKPDQSSIQSGLQSKILAAVQAEEDSVYIDEQLTGHVFLGAEVSYKYYFNSTKPFRPFCAVGIGMGSITSISGRIKDTIDVSDIDMNDPSSLQNSLGGADLSSGGGGDISNIQSSYMYPTMEAGFEYRMAPGAKFNASIPFKYFIDKSGNSANSLSFGVNLSLVFTLNPGKIPGWKSLKSEKAHRNQ